jgi:hypothetical protein
MSVSMMTLALPEAPAAEAAEREVRTEACREDGVRR